MAVTFSRPEEMIFLGKTKKNSKSTKIMYQSTDIYIE